MYLFHILLNSIVECEFEKKGILMIAANTSEKIGDESEQMDALLIGPPGLAKSGIIKKSGQKSFLEAVE